MGSRRRPFRINSTTEGPAPYSRGWLAPWRGDWGPLADGHSRLGRERKRQAALLAARYPGPDALGLRAEAAELRAIATMLRAQLGLDPKVTVRKLTAVQKTAGATLALFVSTRAASNGHGHDELSALLDRGSGD
jgi:hypothetical protein